MENFTENMDGPMRPTGGYSSPLMAHASGARLTVDLLQEQIPKIREGEVAQKKLDTETGLTSSEALPLKKTVREGQKAKDKLFAAALPLIRTVSVREYKRRQQWNSRVSLDDLMQEAIVGFFKGLSGFKTEAIRKSATNYLGQWMLVEMRRAAEVMDHDLQVGHDAGERFRRVRALRSRLVNDLGREPTDEEIADASRNPEYVTRPGLVGKTPEDGDKPHVGKGLTTAQVAEERTSRGRVGHVMRMTSGSEDSEDGPQLSGFVDSNRVVITEDPIVGPNDPALITAESEGAAVIATLVSRVLVEMKLPQIQTEIIGRRYGLPPYEEESSARAIARTMGVHRERVSKVLAAFTGEMTLPGGSFHKIVAELSYDDLDALGLTWLTETLGDWDSETMTDIVPPSILTETITITVTQGEVEEISAYVAWYQCDYEDKIYTAPLESPNLALKTLLCPDCGHMGNLIRTSKVAATASDN